MTTQSNTKATFKRTGEEEQIRQLSMSQDTPILYAVRYGIPPSDPTYVVRDSNGKALIANRTDKDEVRELGDKYRTEQPNGEFELRTIDGPKMLEWVLCIRSAWSGNVKTERTRDAELQDRIREGKALYAKHLQAISEQLDEDLFGRD